MTFVPSLREVVYALYGAWRLLLLDPQAVSYFGADRAACWRSFFAAVLVAPGHLILQLLPARHGDVDGLALILLQFLAYVITWTAFPVVMIHLAELLNRQQLIWRFITGFNWAQVLIIALYLPLALLVASGALSDGLVAFLELAAALAVLAYSWQIARTLLNLSGMAAAGVTVLALILEIAISVLVQSALA